jgi:hypothetical protein
MPTSTVGRSFAGRFHGSYPDLWRSAKRLPSPILQYATPFLGLHGGQDKILNPNDYARDENGIVPFERRTLQRHTEADESLQDRQPTSIQFEGKTLDDLTVP